MCSQVHLRRHLGDIKALAGTLGIVAGAGISRDLALSTKDRQPSRPSLLKRMEEAVEHEVDEL